MIERHFLIPFVARLALAEKQIQQNYRPLIAVHKWFARRPGTLFRALILSEYQEQRIDQTFFHGHSFADKHILDPFMGGGTTVVEANRLACIVTAADINPMSWWIVRQQIQDLDLRAYAEAAATLRAHLDEEIGRFFQTRCPKTGKTAEVKYFLWVKTVKCGSCGRLHDLFPSHLIAQDVRHTANVFTCGHCGTLFESKDRKHPGPCRSCGKPLPTTHIAGRNRSRCLHCDAALVYPQATPPTHRLFAIEYYLPQGPANGARKGRLFKAPDAEDIAKFEEAEQRLRTIRPHFVPKDAIPNGDETERLHRWGYHHYRELFNARQLLGLELSCRWISKYPDERIREALATNLSDLLRYQNMLCRYDIMALKSLDIFSVHGFPVGLIQCESNILGIAGPTGLPVGSGGWLNITEKFAKAKSYCAQPFEIRHNGNSKVEVPIPGEWIGTYRNGSQPPERRQVDLICGDSTTLPGCDQFDGIFTDPPYFGNVQYAELMDFCYVWLRNLAGAKHPEFSSPTTRNAGELTGNVNMGRDLVHFTEGISATFCNAAGRLRLGRPLAFTYHHNKLDAYVPLAVSILDAGLVCSASLPCPAEMGASIHINGTGSSVIDTVFVCRQTGRVPRRWIVGTATELARLIQEEVQALAEGGLEATQGDIRCIAHGHLTRLAIWNLRASWRRDSSTPKRMEAVRTWYREFGGLEAVLASLDSSFTSAPSRQDWMLDGMLRETMETYDEVPF
jgi:adenine-specific DNA methylase